MASRGTLLRSLHGRDSEDAQSRSRTLATLALSGGACNGSSRSACKARPGVSFCDDLERAPVSASLARANNNNDQPNNEVQLSTSTSSSRRRILGDLPACTLFAAAIVALSAFLTSSLGPGATIGTLRGTQTLVCSTASRSEANFESLSANS